MTLITCEMLRALPIYVLYVNVLFSLVSVVLGIHLFLI